MGSHTPDASWSSGGGGGSIDFDFDIPDIATLDEATSTLTTKTIFYPDVPQYVPEKGERDVHAGGYGGSFLDNTVPVMKDLALGVVSSYNGGRAGYPDPHEKNGSGHPNPTASNGLVGLHDITRIKYDTSDNVLGGAGGGGGGYGFYGGDTYVHLNGVSQGNSLGGPERILGGKPGGAFAVNDSGHLDPQYSNIVAINKSRFGRIEGPLTDLNGNIIQTRIGF
jgi:hypothetical protein